MQMKININIERNSNIELYRIILMLLIISHHYVVNSGLTSVGGPIAAHPFAWKSFFLLFWGAWGKMAINGFVLVTGYFMCTTKIKIRNWIKLLSVVFFYRVVIYLIFLFSGYEPFNVSSLVKALFPINQFTDGFISCFLAFYFLIPFLKVLVNVLDEPRHQCLMIILLLIFSVMGSIPGFGISFNYIEWFCVLFIIGSYIRMYPKKIYENKFFWGGYYRADVIFFN